MASMMDMQAFVIGSMVPSVENPILQMAWQLLYGWLRKVRLGFSLGSSHSPRLLSERWL